MRTIYVKLIINIALPNSILLSVHKMAIKNNLPWPTLTKQTLYSIGISTENDIVNIQRAILERMKEIYYLNSFEDLMDSLGRKPSKHRSMLD